MQSSSNEFQTTLRVSYERVYSEEDKNAIQTLIPADSNSHRRRQDTKYSIEQTAIHDSLSSAWVSRKMATQDFRDAADVQSFGRPVIRSPPVAERSDDPSVHSGSFVKGVNSSGESEAGDAQYCARNLPRTASNKSVSL